MTLPTDSRPEITFSVKHTELPTAGYDWQVRIVLSGEEPITESGLASWGRSRRAIRRRVRKSLGWPGYLRVRRLMP